MSNESLQNIFTRLQRQIEDTSNQPDINKRFQASLELIMSSHYDHNIKLECNSGSANLKLKRQNYVNHFNSKKGCEINPYFRTNNCENKYHFKKSYYKCAVCFARTCKNCCTSDETLQVRFQKYIKTNLTLSGSPSTATFYKTKYICNACLLTLVESVKQIQIIVPQKGLATLLEESLYKFEQINIQMLYGLIFYGNIQTKSLTITTKTKCTFIKQYLYDRFSDVLKVVGTQNLRIFLNSLKKHNENVAEVIHQEQLQLFEELPVVTTSPSTVAKKKNFYTFIELLKKEYDSRSNSITWLKQLTHYWRHKYLPLTFMETDLSKITKVILKTVLDKPGKDKAFSGDDNDIKQFIEIYNEYLDSRGGPGRLGPVRNQLEREYASIMQQELELLETAKSGTAERGTAHRVALLANGGKKQHKYIKRKKVNVKKVGVYRSKSGYFYRRYKNGKVKRISKETYKKSKKK